MKLHSILGILAVIAILFISSSLVAAQGYPHAIIGDVKDVNGTIIPGASVTITNQRTSESLTVVSDDSGRYQTDLSAMPSGYQIGDKITVSAESGDLSGSSEITVSSGPNDVCNVIVEESTGTPFPAFGILVIIIAGLAISISFFHRR